MILSGKKIFRASDLFAGIGGIRLGFKIAFADQIEFVFSNEIDDNACKTYETNFKENPRGDITKIYPKDIPDFDILLAGFPCQAFSIAGERRGFEDARGTLFFHIAEIINEKKPIAFFLENVKHLQHHDKGRTFRTIKRILEQDLGYYVHHKVLEARDFGLPQRRPRIYMVGIKKNYRFEFPKPIDGHLPVKDILESNVDESYYLSQQYLNTLKKHRARHQAKGHGFGYEVLDKNGIANTLVCGGMGHERNLVKDVIKYDFWKPGDDPFKKKNNEGVRKMTVREWARLQGFPDTFSFPVPKSKAYRQLANSVPVPVIKAIADQIKFTLENKEILKEPRQTAITSFK